MNAENLTTALNDLVEYLNDSQLGYQQCSDVVKDSKLSNLFSALSMKRKNMAQELAEKVRLLGKAPKEGGSVTGAAHRLFVDLKGALTGGNVDSIINEVKRGENTMINRYKEVLREKLPEDWHRVLSVHLSQFEQDLASMDEISVMKT